MTDTGFDGSFDILFPADDALAGNTADQVDGNVYHKRSWIREYGNQEPVVNRGSYPAIPARCPQSSVLPERTIHTKRDRSRTMAPLRESGLASMVKLTVVIEVDAQRDCVSQFDKTTMAKVNGSDAKNIDSLDRAK